MHYIKKKGKFDAKCWMPKNVSFQIGRDFAGKSLGLSLYRFYYYSLALIFIVLAYPDLVSSTQYIHEFVRLHSRLS